MIANFTVSTAHAGVHAYIHTGTFTGIYSCVCEALFPLRSKKKKTRFLCANKRAEIYGKDSNGFHTYISFLFMLHILYIFGF